MEQRNPNDPEPVDRELLEAIRREQNRPKVSPAFTDFVAVATILLLVYAWWHSATSGH